MRAGKQIRDPGSVLFVDDEVGMVSHRGHGVGHGSADLSHPEQRQVVLGVPDRDRVM